ncbi:MAG: hypothetical protein M1832_002997 [Thelocarpon impressellum]|nr:MAG: hypothetical protein M1832_002997 [Thelocarpon impressellum]
MSKKSGHSLSPQLTPTKQQRQPPPSLFLGPPSRNASHVSLSIPSANQPSAGPSTATSPASAVAQRAPLLRNRSIRGGFPRLDGGPEPAAIASITSPLRAAGPRQQQHDEGRNQADRADAQWAEMQRTLEGVEVSAFSGAHVFGGDHSKALEGLRTAQIALAQAWARSEADEASDVTTPGRSPSGGPVPDESVGLPTRATSTRAASAETAPESIASAGNTASPPDKDRPRAPTVEDETGRDILLARKRREANDRYFQRVNEGVLDVVARLENVAVAMSGVKQESRHIWTDDVEESFSGSGSAG